MNKFWKAVGNFFTKNIGIKFLALVLAALAVAMININ